MTLALSFFCASTAQADKSKKLTPTEIITILKDKVNSTGNIADAVEEATGQRGFMTHDMKPIFKTKIVRPAATSFAIMNRASIRIAFTFDHHFSTVGFRYVA